MGVGMHVEIQVEMASKSITGIFYYIVPTNLVHLSDT